MKLSESTTADPAHRALEASHYASSNEVDRGVGAAEIIRLRGRGRTILRDSGGLKSEYKQLVSYRGGDIYLLPSQ